jgi:hypothetical protein
MGALPDAPVSSRFIDHLDRPGFGISIRVIPDASAGCGCGIEAPFRHYDVASPQGQRMLASYERGVKAMLALRQLIPSIDSVMPLFILLSLRMKTGGFLYGIEALSVTWSKFFAS